VDESNVVVSTVPNVEPNLSPNEIESPIPCKLEIEGRKRMLTSDVWNHFKRKMIDGKTKAICNYCGKKVVGNPR